MHFAKNKRLSTIRAVHKLRLVAFRKRPPQQSSHPALID